MVKLLNYINASKFLPDYCGIPYNTWTRMKMGGKDNKGNALTFSEEDKAKIRAGLKKLAADGKALTAATVLQK